MLFRNWSSQNPGWVKFMTSASAIWKLYRSSVGHHDLLSVIALGSTVGFFWFLISLKEKKADEFQKSFTDCIKMLGSRGHCQLYESYPASLRGSFTCPQHRTLCQPPGFSPSALPLCMDGMVGQTLGRAQLSQASGIPWSPWSRGFSLWSWEPTSFIVVHQWDDGTANEWLHTLASCQRRLTWTRVPSLDQKWYAETDLNSNL